MRMTGKIEQKEMVAGEGTVDLAVRGANQLGNHLTGTVRVVLPTPSA